MKDRLGGYDQLELRAAIGKTTGQSAKNYIQNHIRDNKKTSNCNLASAFWVGFFQEFELTSQKFKVLDSSDDAAEEEPINDELLTALAQAHDTNPAQRRSDQFLNWLAYSDGCNLTELKFMISSSKECPVITRKGSLKIQVYILKFLGKYELHLKWKAFWKLVQDDFDSAFAEHVSCNAPSAAIRAQYTDGLRHAFGPLIS
jgi:hypothetical protein